jgi:basic membrane lipoprotein Med (substrate-binding protein (PBP1-ABC) superfamily)
VSKARLVLVCGSRGFDIDGDARRIVWNRLDAIKTAPRDLRIIVGGANGPDEFARKWAVETEINHTVIYAQWEDHGKRAGIIRNLAMLDEGPDLVLAFWDGTSKGTLHTITEAERRGIPVERVLDTRGSAAAQESPSPASSEEGDE